MALQPPIKLSKLLQPTRIVELNTADKFEAIRQLCETFRDETRVANVDTLYDAIVKRERVASTAVGNAIAIPHAKIAEVGDYVLAVGRSREGIPFEAPDGKPVHLIFLLAASVSQAREFVRMLAQVTHLIKNEAIRGELIMAELPGPFCDIVKQHVS